ncbi:MAG: hypothetical protein RLZZ383_42 [Pseudomonadota bacterium]|jgi:hypothetical protein
MGLAAGLSLAGFALVVTPAPVRSVAEAAPAGERTAWDRASAPRIVAVGDVHGDVDRLRALLVGTAVIDADDHWVAGRAVLVQTGDRLDRGAREGAVVALLDALAVEAASAGGAVLQLLGNHEVMNVAGDLRYVVPEALADFGARGSLAGRREAFAPGGPAAVALAEHPVTVVVGDTLFVHGGWSEADARLGRGALDAAARAWMLGQGPRPPQLFAEDGPLWSRSLSRGDVDCGALAAVLAAAGVRRMVVGHTPQEHGVTSACAGAVWRIDVGLSAHYGGPLEALEILGDQVRAIAPRVAAMP